MDIYTIGEVIHPLSAVYVGDDDLTFISKRDTCEGNFFLYKENFLLSAADARINNYSSLYLTSNQYASNIFKLNTLTTSSNVDIIMMSAPDTGRYLYLPDNATDNIDPTFVKSVSDSNAAFEIEYRDDTTVRIACQRGSNRYYLVFESDKFYFTKLIPFIRYANFKYILTNGKLFIFKVTDTTQTVVSCKGSKLSMLPASNFKSAYFKLKLATQQIQPKIDTSWVSYDTTNLNALNVATNRSSAKLKNNFLICNQYSSLTGDSLPVNFLTLKNQHTHTERSHRVNDIEQFSKGVPSVNKRNYTKLITGVEQEHGNYNIAIPYEFYSVDYKFLADTYTTFKLPGSLYPYSRINVNDAQFKLTGSIGSDTPYTSDKIFYRDTKSSNKDGQYLCTWLSAGSPNADSIWVDRYFYPERSSQFNALTGRTFHNFVGSLGELMTTSLPESSYYDSSYLYTSLEEENLNTPRSIKSSINGYSFFDKNSDLVFLPNEEYIYQRIGDKFVESVVNAISSNLIQDSVVAFTAKGAPVSVSEKEITLNNDTFGLAENFQRINATSQATISVWVNMEDWQTPPGHQIIGSLNERGFSMLCDPVVTPFIKVQDGKQIITFNSDFDIIDAAYHNAPELDTVILSSVKSDYAYTTTTYKITGYHAKDILRTDHLDAFQPVVTYYTLTSEDATSIYDKKDIKVTPNNRCPLILIDSASTTPRYLLADNNTFYGTPLTGLVVEPCQLK